MTDEETEGRICGTYAMAQEHRKRGEPLDEACRIARNDYQAQYRAKKPESLAQQAQQSLARSRALARMAEKYPRVYKKMLAEEKALIESEDA